MEVSGDRYEEVESRNVELIALGISGYVINVFKIDDIRFVAANNMRISSGDSFCGFEGHSEHFRFTFFVVIKIKNSNVIPS